ncbi:sensor histidine kinase [Roseibium aggregatum]|uniref:histidine kinase n=1 Tax=Roseibium aggregatum TaxID=187304 RepID=A0A926S3D4_9HYPH|nr:HAMP domain-containing sensor histidine kinase [Roseibium aggregatum]MBD1545213.1 HAMP domain-containing histidine kinase [Roseibium aggregatum]
MRNFLIQLADDLRNFYGQLDGFLHPSVADDPWQRPRHKAFLAGCFLSGTAALVVLPLHLALAGPTSPALTFLLAFMLGQWPLALYLLQSGNLERAYGFSSALFAAFLAGLCAITGGLSSFALVWFAVVPMEAALSGTRRIILAVCAACAGLLTLLAFLPEFPALNAVSDPASMLLSALAACVYMTVLALRLALEQRRARGLIAAGEGRWRQLNDSTQEIACLCLADGTVKVLGGPLEDLLGLTQRQISGDWLFQRLLVSDRPQYLTALAEARAGTAPVHLDVRLRKGGNRPGEEGLAEYVRLGLQIRKPASASAKAAATPADTDNLILTLKEDLPAESRNAVENDNGNDNGADRWTGNIADLEGPLADIVNYADLLRKSAQGKTGWAQGCEYADLIHRSGVEMLQTVQKRDGAVRIEAGPRALSIEPVDLEGILESCRAMLAPVADRRNIVLDMCGNFDLPRIPADRKALRQIALDLMTYAIQSATADGTVLVTGQREEGAVLIELIVTQKGAEPAYGPQDFRTVRGQGTAGLLDDAAGGEDLAIAAGLARLHGGSLSCQVRAEEGLVISLRLPTGAAKSSARTLIAQARDVPRRRASL